MSDIHETHDLRSSMSDQYDFVCVNCNEADWSHSPSGHKLGDPCPSVPAKDPRDPKQGAGAQKVPFATLPWAVIAEDAVAHGEGAIKYARHNWRDGEVLASTYFAAAMRHLTSWFEGEDIDPESGLSHLVKARASLGVLRDAQIQGTAVDDRPSPSPPSHMTDLNAATVEMTARVTELKSKGI